MDTEKTETGSMPANVSYEGRVLGTSAIRSRAARVAVLAVALLVSIGSDAFAAADTSPDKRITVVFRFDDYSATSNTEVEVKSIEAFRTRGICCTFSIIPFICSGSVHDSRAQEGIPLTEAKADILKEAVEAGALELALHGYAHQTIRDTGGWTEYAGLSYEAQLGKLREGKEFLDELLGQPLTIFVPPWNSYDANTTRALGDSGFRCLSAATFGLGEGPSSLKFLPATCSLLELRDAVETARRGVDAAPLVVALFHNYDFVEADTNQGIMTYQDFAGLLDWVVSQQDVDVRSMSEVIDMGADLSGSRLAANGSFGQWPDYVPPFMPELAGVPTGVYLSQDAVRGLAGAKSRLYVGTALFYLSVVLVPALLVFALERVVLSRIAVLVTLLKYAALILLAAAMVYGGRNLQLGYRGALAIFGILGVCTGIWAGALTGSRRRRATPAT